MPPPKTSPSTQDTHMKAMANRPMRFARGHAPSASPPRFDTKSRPKKARLRQKTLPWLRKATRAVPIKASKPTKMQEVASTAPMNASWLIMTLHQTKGAGGISCDLLPQHEGKGPVCIFEPHSHWKRRFSHLEARRFSTRPLVHYPVQGGAFSTQHLAPDGEVG